MSYDLILFDPAGLADFPVDPTDIVEWVNELVAANDSLSNPADITLSLKDVLSELHTKYGDISANDSPWAMWPPATIGGGRYCTLNLARGTDTMNFLISLHGRARKHGLVLLDPQGRNALMSAPQGGGMLD